MIAERIITNLFGQRVSHELDGSVKTHSEQQLPVQFYELADFNSQHEQEALIIYMQSFPEEERDPIEEIAANLHQPETSAAIHHFRIMVEAGQVIGIAIFSSFRLYWMGYLKFIAIRQDIRSKGYGSLLLREVADQVRQDGFRQTGWPYIGVVFEVERPEEAEDETQRELREKRIRFYERNGARLLEDVDFIAPPVAPGQPPLPFHLMVRTTVPKMLRGRGIRQMMIENVLLAGYGEAPASPFVRHALAEK